MNVIDSLIPLNQAALSCGFRMPFVQSESLDAPDFIPTGSMRKSEHYSHTVDAVIDFSTRD
jgi:hypothetical protein